MSYIKGLVYAMSLYTRIPMPASRLEREDGKKAIVFLPAAGAVIGILIYVISIVFGNNVIPVLFKLSVYILIPLLVTGGFHVDGFMDVADARSSYKSREEKLTILKDPHIGSFAVIRLAMVGLCWLGGMGVIAGYANKDYLKLYAISFFTVRAACGIMSLCLRRAKKDGMLHSETEGADNADKVILIFELIAGALLMIMIKPVASLAAVAMLALFSACYRKLCYNEFGGVTGDTAGYYITVGETVMLMMLAVSEIIELS